MPQALPLVAQPDLPSRVNAVERDGYVYLPGVLDDGDQVARLREHMERLEPLAESFDQGHDPKRGFLNRAINNAFNRDPHFVQFLDYPGVIEIAEALLGAECHVIAMTSWLTGPGRPDQMLHADYQPPLKDRPLIDRPAVVGRRGERAPLRVPVAPGFGQLRGQQQVPGHRHAPGCAYRRGSSSAAFSSSATPTSPIPAAAEVR